MNTHEPAVYDLFKDERGEPRLRPCAVLFLDLLGTSEPRDQKDAQRHLLATHGALARARRMGGSERTDQHTCVSSWFSDNLCLVYPVQPGIDGATAVGLAVATAATHQLSLSLDGMFSRGAVTFGSFYADPNFIYGPALNLAVALEKCAAWPRVILDESAETLALHSLIEHEGGAEDATWRASLLVDEHGVAFVNYLDAIELFLDEVDRVRENLRLHKKNVGGNLKVGHPLKIHDKYRRLATYHDYFLKGLVRQDLVKDLYVHPKEPLGVLRPFAAEVPAIETEELPT